MGRWKLVYEDRTEENIIQEMLDSVPNELDKSENKFIHNALSAAAIKFAETYIDLEFLKDKLDVENLEGEELERFINQRTGITRHPATKGTEIVTITGQEGTSISIGDLVASDTVNFISLEDVSIDSTGEMLVEVECEVEGSVGNVPVGAIRHFPVTIPGLVSVTNKNPVTNGYDAESDESLLERYYQRIRTPVTSGNKHHYLNWAKEVVGVGDAKVFPLWEGGNTVKVVIIDSNKQPASQELIEEVQEYIDPGISGLGEGQAPIGAYCTVASATGKVIDIEFSLVSDDSFDVDSLENNLKGYLAEIAFKEDLVSYAKIGATILSTEGVVDYTNLMVDGGMSNILIGEEEVAILGEVIAHD